MLERGPNEGTPNGPFIYPLHLNGRCVVRCALGDAVRRTRRLDVCRHDRPPLFRRVGRTVVFTHRIGLILPTVIEVDLIAMTRSSREGLVPHANPTLLRLPVGGRLVGNVAQKCQMLAEHRSRGNLGQPLEPTSREPTQLVAPHS